jgi:predicted dehydrogenase
MASVVNVALVGCGYWGINLCRALAQSPRFNLLWVCDGDPAALVRAGRHAHAAHTSANLEPVLADERVEAVVVATPVASHAAVAGAVLRSGRHALVEKPLARSVAEAEDLCRLAAESDRVLMVGHTFLYNGAVRRIKEMIDAGELGELRYVFARRLNLGIVRHDVDALWNLAPHDVSMIQHWLDRPVVRVSAVGHAFLQPGIADVVFAHMTYQGNVAAHIQVSWLDPGKVRQATLVGSRRMLVYDDTSADSRITVYDKGIDVANIDDNLGGFETYAQHQLKVRAGDVWIPRVEFSEPLVTEVHEFADSIEAGRAPLTDGRSGVEVVRVLEQLSAAMVVEQAG